MLCVLPKRFRAADQARSSRHKPPSSLEPQGEPACRRGDQRC